MSKIKKIIISVILLLSVAIASLYYYGRFHNVNFFDFKYIQSYWKSNDHNTNTNNEQNDTTKDNHDNIEKTKEPEKKGKSLEEKQAVMKTDTPTMNAYGLYYDYANMTLPEVIHIAVSPYIYNIFLSLFSKIYIVILTIYFLNFKTYSIIIIKLIK